ncbi:MAG: TetR/AcrR family transcriptional regulator [Syntrophaceae bacterium]
MTKSKRLIPLREPRQSRSRVTYDAILEATTQLLIERGYAATTTNHIAERAGISIGSLYQYFPNKEAIAVELLQRHILGGPAYMESKITHAMKYLRDPVKIVKAFIEAACDHHADNPTLHKVLEEEVPHPPHIREAIRRNEDLFAVALANLIEQQRPQQVPNLTVAARLVFVIIKTMSHWYILYQQAEIERDVFVDEMTAIVIRYLLPSQSPKDLC